MYKSDVTSRYLDLAGSWLRGDGSVLFYGAPSPDAFDALIRALDGRPVLRCRAADTDPARPLRALISLFADVDEAKLAPLPEAHRRVLTESIFCHGAPAPSESSADVVGPAVLTLLRLLSTSTPLLLVFDAMHRLDRLTRDVLRFAAEPLGESSVHMLAAEEVSGSPTPNSYPLCPPPLVMIPLPKAVTSRPNRSRLSGATNL